MLVWVDFIEAKSSKNFLSSDNAGIDPQSQNPHVGEREHTRLCVARSPTTLCCTVPT